MATDIGRIDMSPMVRDGLYYIIELKLDGTSEEALAQIKDKGYHLQYMESGNTIHILGITFSSKKRNITDYREEIIRL